ncbi:MAG: Calx-beta domain-containing protein, partial [Rivularia sp. ALOHA_DT_140]|nr:Calx-beta domain-containing protein [Rivularia sp. ALOHA_DT_140]
TPNHNDYHSCFGIVYFLEVPKALTYTFTRKNTAQGQNVDTTNPLIVNFSVAGTAILDTDYSQAGADEFNSISGKVTIPAGKTTAEVIIKPKPDSEIESDETVKLSLQEGKDYIFGNSQSFEVAKLGVSEGSSMNQGSTKMTVITNDDPKLKAPWVKQFGSDYGYEYFTVDNQGNTYVTGNFDKTTTIGDKTITHSSSNQDALDVFVAKFDRDGNVKWAEEFGNANNEYVKDIAVDKDGNVYFAGIDEDNECCDIFVTKFDKDGNEKWSKNYDKDDNNKLSGIDVDKDGYTYITGEFNALLQLGSTTLDSGQFSDVFVAKLNEQGGVLWAENYGDPNNADKAEDIVIDKDGNSYFFMTEGSEGDQKAVVTKFDKSNGNKLWNKKFGSNNNSGYAWAEDIAIDNQDNIYIAGRFREAVTFDNTNLEGGENGDIYIAKLDSSNNGDVLWVKDFDTQDKDEDSVYVEGIAVDDMSNTYVTGYYYGKSMSIDNFMLYDEGGEGGEGGEGEDAFIAKFDSNGKVKWAQNLGGTNYDTISDVAVNDGNIYIAGEFYQEATFGDKTLKASDSRDSFLVKLEKEKPEISLSVDSKEITEGSSNTITYTFTRKGDATQELTVYFSITGSASFQEDFSLTGTKEFDGKKGKVTFKAGELTAKVTLNIVDDSDAEEDESLGLELAIRSGYMVSATKAKTSITIAKDEKDIVIGSKSDDDDDDDNDDDDDDDDTEFSLASKTKQTFKFKSKFKKGKSSIKFSFKSKSITELKEIAVVTVDDDEGSIDGISSDDEGYTEAALNRAKSIFSLLGNIPNGFSDTDIEKVLEFSSETRFRFISIKGGTLQGVKKGKINKSQVTFSSTDFLQVSESEKNSFDLDFEGVQIKMKFDAKAKKAIGSGLQETIEVLDLRTDVTGKQTVKCSVNREAAYNNFVGFYQVLNEDGGIDTDGDGTADVFVGDENYAQIAVQNRITGIDLSVENQSTAEFTGEFNAGVIVVPFLMVNGNPDNFDEIFFPFIGANSDGFDHVMMIGDNTFAFEDLIGGGDSDYNDFMVKIEFINTTT